MKKKETQEILIKGSTSVNASNANVKVAKQSSSVAWANSETDKNKQTATQPAGAPAEKPAKEGEMSAEERQTQGRVEDQINNEHLQRIERMFREADTDGGGGLDMEEFRDAMKKIMGEVDDEDLDIIFMKVDTNCDGNVDWDEYLNYMLLEYREKDSLQQQTRPLYFPKPLKIVPVAHCEVIVRLQFYPFQTPQADKKDSGEQSGLPKARTQLGRYLSISRDGILYYWSERFKLLRTVNLDTLRRSHAHPIWVTDMICLSNLNLLAISSTGRDVEFYDISASKCDIVFSLTGLDSYILVMDYWSDGKKGVFSMGDAGGSISVFISSDVIRYGLFSTLNSTSKTGGKCRIPTPALFKNTSSIYLCFRVSALHSDWCYQIRFIPELNAVATCSATDNSAMVLTLVPHSQKSRIHNSAFHLRKGILCFDYSPEFNILVTGGFDRIVRIWNPYVTNCATSQMKGHMSAITHIVVNGRDNKIISISKDKNVRVWDLQDCACLQNIHSRNMPLGKFPISSIHYSKDTNTLALSTFQIGVLYGAVEDVEASNKAATSHEQSLCAALYNSNFKQVVSGCHSGVVSVWDILTGEKVMQFAACPGRGVEVTAMAFDGPKRRLITGSKDGSLRLWNFNNGACLFELPKLHDSEVTGILYINQRIYVSSWSKRVIWYLDSKEDDEMEYRQWNCYHSEDIFSMDAHSHKLLVTASYNGDIMVWNIDSGQAFCRFNASESPLPLLPIRVIDQGSARREGSPSGSEESLSSEEDVGDSPRLTPAGTEKSSVSKQRAPALSPPAPKRTSQIRLQQEKRHSSQEVSPVLNTTDSDDEWTSKEKRPATTSTMEDMEKEMDIEEKLDRPRLAVEKVLFLRTRERSPNTAILLTSAADGYVYAWSISHQGGMLGKFKATHGSDTAVCSMSTDLEDQMLLTGDTKGYIMIWDIENYCYCMGDEQESCWSEEEERGGGKCLRLADLIPKYCRVQGPRSLVVEEEKEVWGGWNITLVPPKLLSSWRCHLKAVTHLEYVDRFQLIVTASLDCNVRLWSIAGKYIGTFGQAVWRVGVPSVTPAELPADLRRVGSCQTLRVLNAGSHPHWHCAKKLVERLVKQRRQQSVMMTFKLANKDYSSKLQELLPADPCITESSQEQIEETWRKWQVKGKQRSSVLGRAYKQKVRHHLPNLPDVNTSFSSREQLRIYKSMPYSSLTPVTQPPIPAVLREQQLKTQEGLEPTGKQKRLSKRQTHLRFTPANKVTRKKSPAAKPNGSNSAPAKKAPSL
ncbi:cilia- and flagella-associated protein 337 isoform X2 [Lepisosteus oculatus]|uniref:cilia- and flagella-associated protein 337 isoform X2 n=1 Tax=Lepisosteus oculatus TaxID=7918 RepID=UPI0035F52C88